MKILLVSDWVERMLYNSFDRANFPDMDLILSCGDLPPEYLSFLVTVFNAPLFYVRGNHDGIYDTRPPGGCVNIHGRLVSHGGLTILGLEGSRWYNGGPVQYTERQMGRMVWGLRPKIWWAGGIDMVVTHAPPRHVHDAEDPCHRGFRCYRKLIHRYRPSYFFHGHIHAHFSDPSKRVSILDRTKVVNGCGYLILDVKHDQAAG